MAGYFSTRPVVKKRKAGADSVGYTPNDLQTRMQGAAAGGGGIQPGAHPEFDTETPLDKLVKFGRGVVKKIRGR